MRGVVAADMACRADGKSAGTTTDCRGDDASADADVMQIVFSR